jgi:hypothetical protein
MGLKLFGRSEMSVISPRMSTSPKKQNPITTKKKEKKKNFGGALDARHTYVAFCELTITL